MNIVLIGYRGTGKTTVGRLLASLLGRPFVSLDEEITKKAGMSIPQIVSAFGWDHFRDLESQVVEEVSHDDELVIDAGGGVILKETNVIHLRKNGFIIWLTAPNEIIIERIKGETERPPLKEGKSFIEEVEEVLTERLPLYRMSADVEINTAGISPEEVAGQIQNHMK